MLCGLSNVDCRRLFFDFDSGRGFGFVVHSVERGDDVSAGRLDGERLFGGDGNYFGVAQIAAVVGKTVDDETHYVV